MHASWTNKLHICMLLAIATLAVCSIDLLAAPPLLSHVLHDWYNLPSVRGEC